MLREKSNEVSILIQKILLRLTMKRKLNRTGLCNYEAVEVGKIRRP